MQDQLVVVVDGARARFFRSAERKTPRGEQKNKLDEVETLINPAHRTKDGDLFSESRPGLRKASAGGPGHGVDDKRDAHTSEFDRKFAKLVLSRLEELVHQYEARRVVLAAGPRMLGHLRERRSPFPGVAVGELPKHLTELSAHELCLRLEADDVI